MKKITIITLLSLIGIFPSYAQIELGELFREEGEVAAGDAKQLLKGYLTPLVKSFGYGMANGWYNTAKTHKSLGVDLTATINLATVPDADLFYNIPSLNLQRISLQTVDGAPATDAPTIFGPNVPVWYRYSYTDPQTNITVSRDFEGPRGTGMEEAIGASFIPVPMAQIGIGTVAGTDLKIRFIPTITGDAGGSEFSFNMWGVGIMHDVKQYIPGIKSLPFDLSAFLGYTSLNFELELQDPNNALTSENRGTFNSSSFTFQGLISKKLSIITAYGGLGFNKIGSKFDMLGTYYVDHDNNTGTPELEFNDPVKDLKFPSGGPRATVGVMLKLLVLTLHADYTLQEYNTLSVGLGISVR